MSQSPGVIKAPGQHLTQGKEGNMAKKDILEQNELELLRNRVAQLEAEKANDQGTDRYLREIQDLKKSQTQGMNNVVIKPIQGDKHISLWHVSGHNIGKKVGPIHPGSAEDTFIAFSQAGIKLSMRKPTEEFIEEYKKSKEYKDAEAKEIKRRASKDRSRKESQIEKLTAAIAKSQGIDPSKLNSIKDRAEVGV